MAKFRARPRFPRLWTHLLVKSGHWSCCPAHTDHVIMLTTILLQHVFTHVHDVSTLPTAKTRKLRYFANATKKWRLLGEKDHPRHIASWEKKRKTQDILEWEHISMDRAQARSTDVASGGASRMETQCKQPLDWARPKMRQDTASQKLSYTDVEG